MRLSVIMVRIQNFFEQNWDVRVGLPIGTLYRHKGVQTGPVGTHILAQI